MVDLSHIEILSLVEHDIAMRRVAGTNGGEWAGPCPFCGGRDRFRVWPNHPRGYGQFWCRQCNVSGDALNYIRKRDGLDFADACDALGVNCHNPLARTHNYETQKPRKVPVRKSDEAVIPPHPAWQERGWEFIAYASGELWSETGVNALKSISARGLSDTTIRSSMLGYNPSPLRDSPNRWRSKDSKSIHLASGIVIPNKDITEPDRLWGIGIRQLGGSLSTKYIAVRGTRPALYVPQPITPDRPVVLVEGEFDALIIDQVAGDLVTAVATGSTSWCRKVHWSAQLAHAPKVLVAYDDDEAGDKASAWWLEVLGPKGMRWRPGWDDANAMHVDGACLRSWLAFPLSQIQIERNVTQDRREK